MQDNNERLAVVEKAVEGIERGVSRLEQKLDSLLENIEKKFVPRQEYDLAQHNIITEMKDLRDEIKSMKERNYKIVGGIVTSIVAIAAALIEALVHFK